MPGIEGIEREDFHDCEVRGIVRNSVRGRRAARLPASPLLLSAEHFAELAIDLSGILSGFRNQLNPLLSMSWHLELAQQVGSLHDRFDRVTQIVN